MGSRLAGQLASMSEPKAILKLLKGLQNNKLPKMMLN